MLVRVKPESCIGCSCFSHGTDFSKVEGTGSLHVMLVGEASGEMEAREQLPFRPIAPAGSVLERMIRRMGLSREQFTITNVLRCRPRNNYIDGAPWEWSAIQQCRPNLEQAIRERGPKCIVALGGIPMRELSGMTGDAQGIGHLAGYVLPLYRRIKVKCTEVDCGPRCFICGGTGLVDGHEKEGIPVIGNFHPSYLRRGKASHQGVWSRILQRAVNIARGTDRNWMWGVLPDDPSTWQGLNWILRPTPLEAAEFWSYCQQNSQLPVAADFETSESQSLDEDARVGFQDTQIVQAQFAVMKNGKPWAIAMPYEDPFRAIIIAMLHLANPKFGHNWWQFDEKVAKASAEREGWNYAPPIRIHDTLQMFHHWQPDLPAHLQFASSFIQFPFPWKHLAASNLPFYGCADVHSDLLLGLMLEQTLKRDGLWGDETIGYLGQVYHVRPILDRMEERGLPIDDAARLALDKEFDIAQGQLLLEIQGMAPSECCRVHPKDGYKGIPPEVKKIIELVGENDIAAFGVHNHFTEPGDDGESYHYEQHQFKRAVEKNGQPSLEDVLAWCRVYDFNPNSHVQVKDYMRIKGHTIPKSREEDDEGNQKETTAEKAMRRLSNSTGDVFYIKVIEYRGFTKLKGTYIEGFKPGPDGKVHPTFGFDTAIAQLTSKNPNSQNFPKLKPTVQLAKAMRGMIKAESGKVITSWDYKSFHVLTLGFLAEDPTWIRLAKLDMHSFVAGHVMGLWDGPTILKESDQQLMERFKWLKSDPERKRVRDDQAKHGILGIGNGLAAKGLFERYMENFPPQRCTQCSGGGRVSGIRPNTTKQCAECKGTGSIPGLRVAQTFLSALQTLAPKIFAYQRNERKNAHQAGDRGYATPFGFARRFYEVYQFSKGWDPVRDAEPPRGDQAEQAVSYRHTNIAHCHLREVMKELERQGLNERYGLFNQIHDALMFHFDEPLLEEHRQVIPPIMLAPSKVLKNSVFPNGLQVDVEGEWGYVWNDMHEIKIEVRNERAAD